MTIRTFDAIPMGTVPGANLVQLNDMRGAEGELCLTEDYKKIEQKLTEYERYGRQADITIENLERKVEQLAAENAGLKDSVEHAAGCIHAAESEGLIDALSDKDGERLADLIHRRLCHAYLPVKTTATDSFLAEVRAQGVESFAESQKEYVRKNRDELDSMTRAAYCGSAVDAERFAAKLRKGVQS